LSKVPQFQENGCGAFGILLRQKRMGGMDNVLLFVLATIAIAVGILLGLSIVGLIFLRRRNQVVNSLIASEDLVGCAGVVILPLDNTTVGKVRLSLKGSVLELSAQTDAQESFQVGDLVCVVRVADARVWVIAEDTLRCNN
jgi:membrane protein implicated in regulation of membrane protease activity